MKHVRKRTAMLALVCIGVLAIILILWARGWASASKHSRHGPHTGWHRIDVFFGDTKHLGGHKHHSQCGQDKLVVELLGMKRNGYFIDLAANDATRLSNTWKLETESDWRGLCVEPNPIYWRRLSYRKCNTVVAVVGKPRMEQVKFTMHAKQRAASGGIVKEEFDNNEHKPKTGAVPTLLYTIPIVDVLQHFGAPQKIDYFSLDVEGAEFYVMEDFPFAQYTISILTIERPKQELMNLLYSHNYKYVAANNEYGEETLWVHQSVEGSLVMKAVDANNWICGSTKYLEAPKEGSDPPRIKIKK